MDSGSRTRLMTAVILVFGAGLLLGAAVDGSLVAGPIDGTAALAEGTPEDAPRSRVPLYEQVGPNAAQTIQIDSIVKEHRANMDALHDEFRGLYNPRYRALVQEAREAIRGVFPAEQAERYQLLLDEFDQRRAERKNKEDR
ncbi:MAG: hypothetical protein O2992_07700 [Gemmatimonadetes bacterium]|nr:hypothetical protein [Gemmatimonadota bacterium]